MCPRYTFCLCNWSSKFSWRLCLINKHTGTAVCVPVLTDRFHTQNFRDAIPFIWSLENEGSLHTFKHTSVTTSRPPCLYFGVCNHAYARSTRTRCLHSLRPPTMPDPSCICMKVTQPTLATWLIWATDSTTTYATPGTSAYHISFVTHRPW